MEQMVTRLNYADFSKATNNFSENNIIGLGNIGITYKATISNGAFLAVKKLHDSCSHGEQLMSEFKILGTLKHINLLPLLGFCIKSKESLLIYKYMPNGNLYDWLHPVEEEAKVLEWPVRVKIAIGVARGLVWLHHGSNMRIIHLNISSKCILLDENFEPKLSNFWEAMLINYDDNISCVNNEFWEAPFVKEDVLNFGVVLFELIMSNDRGRTAILSAGYDRFQNEYINHHTSISSEYCDLIDKSLVGKGFDAEIFEFLKIASRCTQQISDQRPTMVQLYEDIRQITERYGLIDDCEQLMQLQMSISRPEDRVVAIGTNEGYFNK